MLTICIIFGNVVKTKTVNPLNHNNYCYYIKVPSKTPKQSPNALLINKIILTTILLLILLINNKAVKAQFSLVEWKNSILDESIIDCSYDSTTGNYLLNIMRGDYPANPNFYSEFFNYNHILYLTDSSFTPIDSIYLDVHGKYRLAITTILKATPDSVIVVGRALDTVTYLLDAIVIWLNGNLEIVRDSIYGEQNLNEHLYTAVLNHTGNIILNQGYIHEEYNPELGGVGIYKEIYMQGIVIHSLTDTCLYWYAENIYDYPEIQKYAIIQPPRIFMVDYQFNLDTLFDFNCYGNNLCMWYRSLLLSNKEILMISEYLVFTPQPNMSSDFVLFRANTNEGIYDSLFLIGTPDTNDRWPLISESMNDTFYLACSKNINVPPTDSWISLYKTNFNGEIYWSKHYGGYGEYSTKKIITRADSSLVIFGNFWDFHKFPPAILQRDIVILKADVNSITTGNDEVISKERVHVYPNPFNESVSFDIPENKSCKLILFDLYGKIVYSVKLNDKSMINLSFLENGIYFYTLYENSNCIQRGKLIKH